MLRVAPWRAPSLPPRSAAANKSAAEWQELLGRKVSLRYRLHGDPDHPVSEAIGVVMFVGRDEVSIMTRRGAVTVVPLSDIVAAKTFPD